MKWGGDHMPLSWFCIVGIGLLLRICFFSPPLISSFVLCTICMSLKCDFAWTALSRDIFLTYHGWQKDNLTVCTCVCTCVCVCVHACGSCLQKHVHSFHFYVGIKTLKTALGVQPQHQWRCWRKPQHGGRAGGGHTEPLRPAGPGGLWPQLGPAGRWCRHHHQLQVHRLWWDLQTDPQNPLSLSQHPGRLIGGLLVPVYDMLSSYSCHNWLHCRSWKTVVVMDT